MWRNQSRDLQMIESFQNSLSEFLALKGERWERVDEEVQRSIRPGSPSEDWIVPPDEELTLNTLKKDHDYMRLRSSISHAIPHLKKIASFIHIDLHHDFDWINFVTPLVGSDALEDALKAGKRLEHACREARYFPLNLRYLFRLTEKS